MSTNEVICPVKQVSAAVFPVIHIGLLEGAQTEATVRTRVARSDSEMAAGESEGRAAGGVVAGEQNGAGRAS
jgi:hypothetical protein